jgi:P pilus assembly chaperone PapD
MWLRTALALGAALAIAAPALAQEPEAAPEAVEEEPEAEPRRAKPRPPPRPANSVVVSNATANALTAVVLTGDGDTANLPRTLPPKGRATLTLPKRKGCTVTVQATFQNGGFVDIPSFDVCKERTIRFTE